MTIATVSISYRTAPAETLGKLAVPPEEHSRLLAHLGGLSGVDEVFLLSTCNRVEVYAATDRSAPDACHAVAAILADRAGLPVDDVMAMTRQYAGAPAVEHLLTVTCGLDSMAIGEDQIVAQVKAAGRDAAAAGTSGPVLRALLDAALHTSKRARRETRIGTTGVSLAHAGLDLARDHLGADLGRRQAVVIGSGTMGRLVARLLRRAGVGQLSITSRTPAHAAELAATVGGQPLAAACLSHALADADIVVAAAAAPEPVVRLDDVRRSSRRKPLFVLDLGLPPAVETGVGQLRDVVLADLTAVGQHLSASDVPEQVPQVRAIIASEASAFLAKQKQTATSPLIAALHAQIQALADAELARLEQRLPGLDDKQRAEMAAAVHRILRKVLHQPTIRVKELGTGSDGGVYMEALRQLFDLPVPA